MAGSTVELRTNKSTAEPAQAPSESNELCKEQFGVPCRNIAADNAEALQSAVRSTTIGLHLPSLGLSDSARQPIGSVMDEILQFPSEPNLNMNQVYSQALGKMQQHVETHNQIAAIENSQWCPEYPILSIDPVSPESVAAAFTKALEYGQALCNDWVVGTCVQPRIAKNEF